MFKRKLGLVLLSSLLAACSGSSKQAPSVSTNPPAATAVALVETQPGGSCSNGGVVVRAGLDTNLSQVLDAAEVTDTYTVCNGESGLDALATLLPETDAHCPAGGQRLDTGLDVNGDGTLVGTEITQVAYVCNGVPGASGYNSLTRSTSVGGGTECAAGGQRLDIGLDSNRSGSLDDAEITQTSYVCNGAGGTPLISSQYRSDICLHGGYEQKIGYDLDGDDVLDSAEVTSTSQVCLNNDAPAANRGAASFWWKGNVTGLAMDATTLMVPNDLVCSSNAPEPGLSCNHANFAAPQLFFSDEQDDSVTASVSGLPAGLQLQVNVAEIRPGVFSATSAGLLGNAPATPGTYPFVITVSDGEYSRDYAFRLEIYAPITASIAPVSSTVGEEGGGVAEFDITLSRPIPGDIGVKPQAWRSVKAYSSPYETGSEPDGIGNIEVCPDGQPCIVDTPSGNEVIARGATHFRVRVALEDDSYRTPGSVLVSVAMGDLGLAPWLYTDSPLDEFGNPAFLSVVGRADVTDTDSVEYETAYVCSPSRFFADHAGSYSRIASVPESGTPFTNGNSYTIVVATDGKLTFPADSGSQVFDYFAATNGIASCSRSGDGSFESVQIGTATHSVSLWVNAGGDGALGSPDDVVTASYMRFSDGLSVLFR